MLRFPTALLCLYALILALGASALASNTTLPAYAPNAPRQHRSVAVAPARQSRPRAAAGCKTNAECLRKGLPILKPARRAPRRALVARASETPVPLGVLRLSVAGSSNPVYVQKPPEDSQLVWQTETDKSLGLRVAQPVGQSVQDLTIAAADRAYADSQYLGVHWNDPSTGYAGTTADTYAQLIDSPVSASSPETITSGDGYLIQNTETTIWSFNSDTNELTAVWKNPDGRNAPLYMFVEDGSSLRRIYFNGATRFFDGFTRATLFWDAV